MKKWKEDLKRSFWALRNGWFRYAIRILPRPGRCMCCNRLSIRTNETVAYTVNDGAWLCHHCAVENDKEVYMAWQDYYEGKL